jgi:hypothetical protein
MKDMILGAGFVGAEFRQFAVEDMELPRCRTCDLAEIGLLGGKERSVIHVEDMLLAFGFGFLGRAIAGEIEAVSYPAIGTCIERVPPTGDAVGSGLGKKVIFGPVGAFFIVSLEHLQDESVGHLCLQEALNYGMEAEFIHRELNRDVMVGMDRDEICGRKLGIIKQGNAQILRDDDCREMGAKIRGGV